MQSGKINPEQGQLSELGERDVQLLGDVNCPLCGGLGYLRQELPLGHPEFGKLAICSCRNQQITEQVRQRLFSLSQLDELSQLTFENFDKRGHVGLWPQQANSLELAYNQARMYAETLKGWLLLQGRYGSGKTHLAAAVANYVIGVGVPTLFVTVPDLLDMLRFAFQGVEISFEDRFEEIRQSPFLVMDDFGTQNATPWAQEKLFQIINYRYINKLPMLVTTNLDLRDIDERIRSRLEDPELVTKVRILAPDYRRPAQDMGYSDLSSLELLHDCTFASFDLRKKDAIPKTEMESLERAFNIAFEFAESPQGWLLLTGGHYCGKTHLAAAIANHRLDKGYPQLFIGVTEMLDYLRATFNPTSPVTLDRRFEEYKANSLLILDDLVSHSMTPWVREKLHQLFSYRAFLRLPTVFTTTELPEQMDPWLRSRFQDVRLTITCAITAPAYTGKGLTKNPQRTTRKIAN